ncbi:MAG: hypothetical protein HY906_06725 [Deltaproteobacteria bacterium]|nr:hypothetical protein [Deltaproteobacteria bacterium]
MPLVRILSDALGDGRRPRAHQVLRVDHGTVELAVPRGWIASAGEGCLTVTDATDECALEISYLLLPPLPPEAPSLASRLEHALGADGHEAPIVTRRDGSLDVAWADYEYESPDPHRGDARRPARGRWLLAANDRVQLLATFSYWVDDAPWALEAWEWMMSSIRLAEEPVGDGSLEDWNLRPGSGE